MKKRLFSILIVLTILSSLPQLALAASSEAVYSGGVFTLELTGLRPSSEYVVSLSRVSDTLIAGSARTDTQGGLDFSLTVGTLAIGEHPWMVSPVGTGGAMRQGILSVTEEAPVIPPDDDDDDNGGDQDGNGNGQDGNGEDQDDNGDTGGNGGGQDPGPPAGNGTAPPPAPPQAPAAPPAPPTAPSEPPAEVIVAAFPFVDVPQGAWHRSYIEQAWAMGLMNGISDTNFAPNQTLSRAMVATILHRLAGTPAVTFSPVFTDVPAGRWYSDAVVWAAQNSIVLGVGNNLFSPSANVTREQMAAMMFRYAEFIDADTTFGGWTQSFADIQAVSPWALEAMQWANYNDLIRGQGGDRLNPTGTATRAERAAILVRFTEAFK